MIDYVVCPICGFESGNLTTHIKTHGLTTNIFRERFPDFGYLKSECVRLKQSSIMINNNPMKGKNHMQNALCKMSKNRTGKGIGVCGRYERTAEIKDKISKGVANAHLEGKLRIQGRGCWMFSHKNNKNMWLSSSYEVRVFNVLEQNPFFLQFEREPFFIPYEWNGLIKRYIPDFLVVTEGRIKELWEIKPKFQMAYPINQKKLQVLNQTAMEMDMNACWLNEDNITSFERTINV